MELLESFITVISSSRTLLLQQLFSGLFLQESDRLSTANPCNSVWVKKLSVPFTSFILPGENVLFHVPASKSHRQLQQ